MRASGEEKRDEQDDARKDKRACGNTTLFALESIVIRPGQNFF